MGEEFGIDASYDPKPIPGNWSGSGAHCNFSTLKTRSEGGYNFIIKEIIPILEKTHKEVLTLYGA